ncbi:hypothetical protein BDW74DRAFT_103181 [Aspergillus multicolor]|uniref:uncharacterized protein n=1 Tax=Aspergillus multicolor TaxID=41759 RepID=UPI003CCDBC3E
MLYTPFLVAASASVVFVLVESSATASSTNETSTISGTCYNLDGSEASDYIPCGTGETVNCCHHDDICMSNGLCQQQGDRGSVLSRGSCTDEEWGEGCYAPCSGYNRNTTVTIVNAGHEDKSEYCCGSVRIQGDDDDEVSCEFGDPFTIPAGTAIPNAAGLSSTSPTSTSPSTPHSDTEGNGKDEDEVDPEAEEEEEGEDTSHSSSHDEKQTPSRITTPLVIALGLGIPLGLATICFVLWAIWERRRRQLRDTEARTLGPNAGDMSAARAMGLGLHHRYGPIPSYSDRGTPNQSGFFVPQVVPVPQTQTQGAGVVSPPPTQVQWVEVQWQIPDSEVRRGSTAAQTQTPTQPVVQTETEAETETEPEVEGATPNSRQDRA